MEEAETKALKKLQLKDREIILLGTAHVSKESIKDVQTVIREECPDCVCVELDETRYRALTSKDAWQQIDIAAILKEGKGFLLLANLVLSSFQRRLGAELGVRPGDEMKAAVEEALQQAPPEEGHKNGIGRSSHSYDLKKSVGKK